MSVVYVVLMLAVSAVLLFVIADAVRSVSRRPDWQTPRARLAAEGATLYHLPKASPVSAAQPVAVKAPAVAREEEALAA